MLARYHHDLATGEVVVLWLVTWHKWRKRWKTQWSWHDRIGGMSPKGDLSSRPWPWWISKRFHWRLSSIDIEYIKEIKTSPVNKIKASMKLQVWWDLSMACRGTSLAEIMISNRNKGNMVVQVDPWAGCRLMRGQPDRQVVPRWISWVNYGVQHGDMG